MRYVIDITYFIIGFFIGCYLGAKRGNDKP